MIKIKTIADVVEYQLCTGCGACAFVEPDVFYMVDTLDYGKRPLIHSGKVENGDAFKICPGNSLSHDPQIKYSEGINKELLTGWGPILGVWEGYAADDEIRLAGSSGGATSALSLFALESRKVAGIMHTGASEKSPYVNKSVVSKSRQELLKHTGSRYSPTSPCEDLAKLEKMEGKSVFIGKPCDVAAVNKIKETRQSLDEKLDFTIAFFCAGVPSHEGNIKYLEEKGIDIVDLTDLRYRGNGWPGNWVATFKNADGSISKSETTYAKSWGYLQKYRQWRCYLCPDHTGEFADIAVGDPWYREVEDGEPGKSLIIARTKKGLEVLRAAEKEGYIILESENANLLPLSQPNLLAARGSLWGRLLALKVFGAAVPTYKGFNLFFFWFRLLPLKQKIESILGTVKRIYTKKLLSKIKVNKMNH
jgi:coenzyme F420 hydrogenase subunit beta